MQVNGAWNYCLLGVNKLIGKVLDKWNKFKRNFNNWDYMDRNNIYDYWNKSASDDGLD